MTPRDQCNSTEGLVAVLDTIDAPAVGTDPVATRPVATADDLPRRYLALIAGVAERLLTADHPATMVGDLFALIQSELRLDVFVNYRFDGDCLVLEAQSGLTPLQIESLSELAIGQAVCGCVARDLTPIHATAIQASDDVQTGFVRDMGLDAYACTPLIHGGELLGTLSFGRRWAPLFTPDELSFLHTICHYVALAKHRLRIEEDLRSALETHERLLGELNHRVRNALQLAVGLIALDTGSVSVEAERTLRRAMDRIQVLAAAHRPLYGSPLADRVDLGEMLHGAFEHALPVDTPRHYQMPIDRAVIIALLVHELTILRPPAATGLTLALDRLGGTLQLSLGGLGIDTAAPNTRLVDALVRQLRATLAYAPGQAVLRFTYADDA